MCWWTSDTSETFSPLREEVGLASIVDGAQVEGRLNSPTTFLTALHRAAPGVVVPVLPGNGGGEDLKPALADDYRITSTSTRSSWSPPDPLATSSSGGPNFAAT